MSFRIIYSIVFSILVFPLLGNNPEELYLNEAIQQRDFEETNWQEATAGLDYSSDVKKKAKPKKEEEEEPNNNERRLQRNNPSVSFGEGTASAILKFLIILGGAVCLFLILRSLLGLGSLPRNKKIDTAEKGEINIEKIEENIHESDLNHYIKKALADQNYILAIRLYYLAGLKELSLQNLIKWKKDKTNKEYLREMRGHEKYEELKQMTQIFDRVCYGNFQLQESDFRQIEPMFQQFIQTLSHKPA